MKVLLWKIGALGDVVMTTPLVRQLRAALPAARIDYLVGRSSRAVLEGNPHLDEVLDFDEDILFRRDLGRVGEILGALRGYDEVYVLDKHGIFGTLAALARVPKRVGFRRRAWEGWPHTVRVPYGSLRHEIDYYLDLACAAGLRIDRADRQLELPPPERCELGGSYVVASNSGGSNPGENSSVRQLPWPLFGELVGRLAARHQVVFIGSAAERDAYEPLARAHRAVNLCGRTSLRSAWGVLAGAQAIYTTDTGLMHMAGAVSDKVLAIFGPTHPLRKCPPGVPWVWQDETAYDDRYELFGRVPDGSFFQGLRLADIPDPEALGPVAPRAIGGREHG